MRGIEVPDRVEDFTADPVELFFDLAYVFAFSQLVGVLVHHPDWPTAGEAGLLFGVLWVAWSQLTWSANAISGNGRPVRLLFLLATVVSVPMAASVSTAFGPGGPVFAFSVVSIVAIGMAMQMLSVGRDVDIRASVIRWIAPNALAGAVLIVGAFLDGDARTVAWVLTLTIVLGAMALAGRGVWLIRPGHFAERHGLIVIIALGEVIVAIGLPVVEALEAGEGLPGKTVVALLASGAFAAILFWGYFDRPSPALEHRGAQLTAGLEPGRYVRDVYTWAHAPIVAGIILSAAALEEITLHPSDTLATSFRVMLAAGLGLTLLGVAASIWRAFEAVAKERVVAAVVIAAIAGLAGSVDGLALLLVVDVALAGMLVVEHSRIER